MFAPFEFSVRARSCSIIYDFYEFVFVRVQYILKIRVRVRSCSGENERTPVFALYVFVFVHHWFQLFKVRQTKRFFRFSNRFWKRTFKDSENNRFSNFHGELIFLNFCDLEFFRFCPSALSLWKNMIGIWIFCMSEKLILEKPKFIIITEVILRFSGFVILLTISETQILMTSLYIECVDTINCPCKEGARDVNNIWVAEIIN